MAYHETKIMVEDAQKLVDAHPKIKEVVDSFSKRYAFKTQEQSRREAGQNAYKAESDAMRKEVDKGLKAKADIVAARNADNCAERLCFKLPTDQPYYADAPLTVDARWSVASSISVADVLIVDNLDFAVVPKAGRIVFDLAVCILVGKRIVLPQYLANNKSKDGANTSIKFMAAADQTRGIVMSEEFKTKHRYWRSLIEKECTSRSSQKSCWKLISPAEEFSWSSANKAVSHLDCMNSRWDTLRCDVRFDRKRSANGTFQKVP